MCSGTNSGGSATRPSGKSGKSRQAVGHPSRAYPSPAPRPPGRRRPGRGEAGRPTRGRRHPDGGHDERAGGDLHERLVATREVRRRATAMTTSSAATTASAIASARETSPEDGRAWTVPPGTSPARDEPALERAPTAGERAVVAQRRRQPLEIAAPSAAAAPTSRAAREPGRRPRREGARVGSCRRSGRRARLDDLQLALAVARRAPRRARSRGRGACPQCDSWLASLLRRLP